MQKKIKQVYVPYWKWECFRFGMYSKVNNEKEMIEKAIKFMSDTELFSEAMNYVVFNWKNTMINSMSNNSINRIAFIGQCACFHAIGCPDYLTKKAWKQLDRTDRVLANIEAKKHLKLWTLTQYSNTLKHGRKDVIKTGFQMKLQLN